jgi:hypothetical protein
MERGASDEEAYKHDREVGCTVCGIPAGTTTTSGGFDIEPEKETSVYTRWGHRECGPDSRLIYEGFIAGAHYALNGGGANSICMTVTGASPPHGYSDGNQNGALLYGTEYQNTGVSALDKNHDGDAACAVCEYMKPLQDVSIEWGRQTCSTGDLVYHGLIMADKHRTTTNLCVDWERQVHSRNEAGNNDGNLLYTSEMESGSSDEKAYAPNVDLGCATCAGSPGGTIFTRWGHTDCPQGSSRLYSGFMASAHSAHDGGGANALCMHEAGEVPDGGGTSDVNGNRLYGMEYENTGAVDKSHSEDAACVVCQLDRWEAVYTQWGRSDSCSNGHQALYSGLVMGPRYTQHKGEYLCVDFERVRHAESDSGNNDGGLLYTTEMEQGSSNEEQYPHDKEVGCSVCAAYREEEEDEREDTHELTARRLSDETTVEGPEPDLAAGVEDTTKATRRLAAVESSKSASVGLKIKLGEGGGALVLPGDLSAALQTTVYTERPSSLSSRLPSGWPFMFVQPAWQSSVTLYNGVITDDQAFIGLIEKSLSSWISISGTSAVVLKVSTIGVSESEEHHHGPLGSLTTKPAEAILVEFKCTPSSQDELVFKHVRSALHQSSPTVLAASLRARLMRDYGVDVHDLKVVKASEIKRTASLGTSPAMLVTVIVSTCLAAALLCSVLCGYARRKGYASLRKVDVAQDEESVTARTIRRAEL